MRNCLGWIGGNDEKSAPERDRVLNFHPSAGRPAGIGAGPRPAWCLQSQNVLNILQPQSY